MSSYLLLWFICFFPFAVLLAVLELLNYRNGGSNKQPASTRMKPVGRIRALIGAVTHRLSTADSNSCYPHGEALGDWDFPIAPVSRNKPTERISTGNETVNAGDVTDNGPLRLSSVESGK